jgi:diacylglycerol kinase
MNPISGDFYALDGFHQAISKKKVLRISVDMILSGCTLGYIVPLGYIQKKLFTAIQVLLTA